MSLKCILYKKIPFNLTCITCTTISCYISYLLYVASNSLSPAGIAGVVIGILCFLILIAVSIVICFYLIKCTKGKPTNVNSSFWGSIGTPIIVFRNYVNVWF